MSDFIVKAIGVGLTFFMFLILGIAISFGFGYGLGWMVEVIHGDSITLGPMSLPVWTGLAAVLIGLCSGSNVSHSDD